MKLLFDNNLSPRLPRLLSDIYPASVHVRRILLHEADDSMAWNYAKERQFIIVSKDSDFQQRSLLFGAPPKFVWIRIGNCSVSDSAEFPRKHSPSIHTFNSISSHSHLILP